MRSMDHQLDNPVLEALQASQGIDGTVEIRGGSESKIVRRDLIGKGRFWIFPHLKGNPAAQLPESVGKLASENIDSSL